MPVNTFLYQKHHLFGMKDSVKEREEGCFQDDKSLHHLRQLYRASLLLGIRECLV